LASGVNRGDIWLHTFHSPDKRRPVLVISRQSVIPLIRTVMVAPITTRAHGVPSEVEVGVDEGLKTPSVVNLDHVQTVEQGSLRHYVGSVSSRKMDEVCLALARATGCPPGDRAGMTSRVEKLPARAASEGAPPGENPLSS
jgi:mRNA interferase MazF